MQKRVNVVQWLTVICSVTLAVLVLTGTVHVHAEIGGIGGVGVNSIRPMEICNIGGVGCHTPR